MKKSNIFDSFANRLFPPGSPAIRALPELAPPAAPGLVAIRAMPSSSMPRLTEAEARELKSNTIVPMPIVETRPFYQEGQEPRWQAPELMRMIVLEAGRGGLITAEEKKHFKKAQRKLRRLSHEIENNSFSAIRLTAKLARKNLSKGEDVGETKLFAGNDLLNETRSRRIALKQNRNQILEDLLPLYKIICERLENASRQALAVAVAESKERFNRWGLPGSWQPDAVILNIAACCWMPSAMLACGDLWPSQFLKRLGL
jgi:hypothetical protein